MGRQEDLQEFHGEAREILDKVSTDLVELEKNPKDADLVNRIFRGAHSLKGLAGMLGFTAVAQAAHKTESVLDGIRMGRIPASSDVLDVLLEATEVLSRMVDAVLDDEPDREADSWSDVAERLTEVQNAKREQASTARAIDPEIAKTLSEYEEHRLALALSEGQMPWRIDVSFPFESFDSDLPALKDRLKPYCEVITTMAGDLSSADRMGFGLLVVSRKDPSILLTAAALPDAKVVAVKVIEPAAAPAAPPPAASSGLSGGAFDGFSAGGFDLPSTPASALGTSVTQIDWSALAQAGESSGEISLPSAAPAPAAASAPPVEDERRSSSDRRSGADRRATPRAPSPSAAGGGASDAGATTLRVNIERIDGLMNLVGELVTAKNAISQVAERLKAEHGFKGATLEIYKAKRTLERQLDALQKGIMQVRMLPLDNLFSKLTRVVRNLARENGKEVELVIEGAETELDKVMIDELSDPLIHIMRNAVDHGLETPDVRVDDGKPAKGTLKISAYAKGNHVAIEISDDGRGIDTDRIREKAIQKGLLSPEAKPSEEELIDLIYAPGFSTKDAVSEVSGRGVGMDVVRNNIMKLNGIIDTTTQKGKGTRFTITLPLTLATMKALVVGVAGQAYAIPLASVLECVSPRISDVRTVEGREVLPLRETTLPLVRLDRFFGLDQFEGDILAPEAPRMHVVVVGLAQYRIGLVVDSLGAQQDVVVKPLGAPLTKVEGIMGATNLGNNRAVLVLDVAGVVAAAVGGPREKKAATA